MYILLFLRSARLNLSNTLKTVLSRRWEAGRHNEARPILLVLRHLFYDWNEFWGEEGDIAPNMINDCCHEFFMLFCYS